MFFQSLSNKNLWPPKSIADVFEKVGNHFKATFHIKVHVTCESVWAWKRFPPLNLFSIFVLKTPRGACFSKVCPPSYHLLAQFVILTVGGVKGKKVNYIFNVTDTLSAGATSERKRRLKWLRQSVRVVLLIFTSFFSFSYWFRKQNCWTNNVWISKSTADDGSGFWVNKKISYLNFFRT